MDFFNFLVFFHPSPFFCFVLQKQFQSLSKEVFLSTSIADYFHILKYKKCFQMTKIHDVGLNVKLYTDSLKTQCTITK